MERDGPMKERDLVQRVIAQIEAAGGKAIKIKAGGAEVGTPDILACLRGRFFAIECKVGDNGLTPIQQRRLEEWEKVGAVARVARENFAIGGMR